MPVALDRLRTALADRYQIERQLGMGGMATVYLAHDVRHSRKVALKVLKPELAAVLGAERFLHEIRVTANLHHPNILPLHDSGEADSFLFYVMPYVEGESLRDRLNREKQLEIPEAIRITESVAAALDYAHRHGVIHRDIKPENILLHDGHPSIADFGIALAVRTAGGHRLTETGLSLGTPHYMSPEQAMGDRELDARSDVYSLGVVLYEMLTGDPPYTGSTAQAIVAKVITEKAALVTTLRDTVPDHVAAAIHRALAKLPADRFATAAQFAEAVGEPSAAGTQSRPAITGTRRGVLEAVTPTHVGRVGWFVAAALAAAFAWSVFNPERPTVSLATFEVLPPPDVQLLGSLQGTTVAISPDARRIAFVGIQKGIRRLYVREVGGLSIVPLAGTEDARSVFFSRDGAWIGYGTASQIMKVSASGGAPVSIAQFPAGTLYGFAWSDGFIYAGRSRGPLLKVPETGGALSVASIIDTVRDASHRHPELLPGGKGVVFTKFFGLTVERGGIAELAVQTGEDRNDQALFPGAMMGRYADGIMAAVRFDGSMFAADFDTRRGRASGEFAAILDSIVITPGSGVANFALSDNGSLVYLRGSVTGTLDVVRRDGTIRPLATERRYYAVPRVSPDGRRIAVMLRRPTFDELWVYDVSQETITRMVPELYVTQRGGAKWSPDGKWLALQAAPTANERDDIYVISADGSDAPRRVTSTPAAELDPDWTRDGRSVVYSLMDTTGIGAGDLWQAPVFGEGSPQALYRTAASERYSSVSPDGRWIAYTSNESGLGEVYVRPLAGRGERWQVSVGGGGELGARWGSGRELVYTGGGKLIAAQISTTDGFAVTSRRVIAEGDFTASGFDVLPDGGLVVVRTETQPPRIVVVLNWLDEVKRRLGAR